MRSMTAFAAANSSGDWGTLHIELRSVNHRFLEIAIRLPEELRSQEMALRESISAELVRGKVDLTIRYQPPQEGEALTLNRPLVKRLAQLSREVDQAIYNPAPVNAVDLMRWPGVLQPQPIDQAAISAALQQLLSESLQQLVTLREAEGSRLATQLQQRSATIRTLLGAERERRPDLLIRLQQRGRERLQALDWELEPQRIDQALLQLLQRLDVEEELDRLESHLIAVENALAATEPVGRRLDFLMQELHREANTLGTKAADVGGSQVALELKLLIEQMREQVQNIE